MPEMPTLTSLFRAQAAATPEARAAVVGTRHIKYADFFQWAQTIAVDLLQRGLQPETLVGLSAERSIEMAAGIFGILLAGGAYVPLSPSLPAARLDQMIQDACLEWALVAGLPRWRASVRQTLSLAPASGKLPKMPSLELPDIRPEQLAYVLYTSGSTGKPKGVMVEHGNVVAHLQAIEQIAPHRSPLVGSQVASYTFDASVWEIFSNLCYGGSLHIIHHPEDVSALADVLLDQHVSSAFLPPGILDDLGERLKRRPADVALDRLMVGVETIPQRTLQRFLDLNPGMRIINGYGPTETVVCATYYIFKPMTAPSAATPIGVALPGYTVRLVDDQLQPVAAGEAGEVLIGGGGVGRGYLNDPALTGARFIPDPVPARVGAALSTDRTTLPPSRLYRTGDYARQLPDGNLEFIGRMDNQVKIRGYRVETGDVEAAILTHPQIKTAVASTVADPAGTKRLVAYVIYESGMAAPSPAELRDFLAGCLPEYMVPSLVIPVESVPRTVHGKVDLAALPAPDWSQRRLDTPIVPPATPVEERLVSLWSELLGVREISATDNFFDLGGNSLLAARLLARIEQVFGKPLLLSTLFEIPTLAELAAWIQGIAASASKAGGLQPASQIPAQSSTCRMVPLSYSQQRLWFLAQLEPGSPAYHNPFALRLRGDLDIQTLHASLNALVSRHAILRTTFSEQDGVPYQLVASELEIGLPIIDLCGLAADARDQELHRQLSHSIHQPFDLGCGPLIRAALYRLAPQDYLLLVNLHHLVFDAWSKGILLQELQEFYAAGFEQDHSLLEKGLGPSLPIQYADYALWEQSGGQAAQFQEQLGFWQKQLGNSSGAAALPLLNLPVDYPRQPARLKNGEGRVLYLDLPHPLLEKLASLGQQTSATLFMVLFSAFITLLYRYTGQEDLLVGSYVANRSNPETQGMIGSFINPILLRVTSSGRWPFIQLLQHVRHLALAAYDHQELPLELLTAALKIDQHKSSPSPFAVAFNFLDFPVPQLDMPGLHAADFFLDVGSQVCDMHVEDLLVEVVPGGDGLLVKFQYKASLFEQVTISRWMAHFRRLLEDICEDPHQTLVGLPLLSPDEQRTILTQWNATYTSYPRDLCVCQLFESQVQKTPASIAVCSGKNSLTYQDLNERANQLARYLRTLGVGPGMLVGICAERSLEMAVAILGVLKAGGAYLPLDPAYPKERLEFVLRDAQVPIVLAMGRFPVAESMDDRHWLHLNDILELASQYSCENLALPIQPDDLVYVIYTSGSTGRPKGVLVRHQALVNHNLAIAGAYGLQLEDRVLQFASFSFDVAAEEIFPSWLHGASLVLFPGLQAVSIAEFARFLEDEQITVLNLPASYWRAWMEELERAGSPLPGSLRLVVVGSETIFSTDLAAWRKLAGPHVRWLNAYGTSEATITSIIYEPPSELESRRHFTVPVGRPISNTQVYILDSSQNPLPVGVPGELFLGGDGLARGYLNQPELTAECFIPNPFSPGSSASMLPGRLYRTGDLARYLPDGNIELLGRTDDQVKIRGFRVELNEVEFVILGHPAIKQAAVMVSEDPAWGGWVGDPRLAAYLVSQPGVALSVHELRLFLKSRLPDYMLPAAFVFLDALPVLPNGKVDRKALPAPDRSGLAEQETYLPPRTPLEEALARTEAQVLGIGRVGIEDNFFELGGHSLLAARLMAELEREFGQRLPLVTVFENPTVARLAEALEKQGWSQQIAQVVTNYEPIQVTRPEHRPLPASYGEFRMWFLAILEPDNPTFMIPFVLHIKGGLEPPLLEASLNKVIERHEILRTTYPSPEGFPVRSIAPTMTIQLPVEDLSGFTGQEQKLELEQRLREQVGQTFSQAVGPLLRGKLYRLGLDEHVLQVCVAHIIFDGWSKDILLEELWTFYKALASGEQPRLPAMPLQYADYAIWQESAAYNQLVESQLDYWRRQLAGQWPKLAFPPDYTRPAKPSFRGETQFMEITGEVLQRLKNLAQCSQSTLYMVLQTAFDVLLYHYTGVEDVLTWSVISNRERTEVQRMIGMLVNSVTLRTQLSGDLTFTEALSRVRETAVGAIHHPDVPVERLLMSFWNQINQFDYRSLVPIMMSFVNLTHFPISVPGLQIDEYPFDTGLASFDLFLEIAEKPGSLLCAFNYSVDLYKPETIRRAMGAYQAILVAVAADPEQKLAELKCILD